MDGIPSKGPVASLESNAPAQASDQPQSSRWDYDVFISYRRIDGQPFANWLRWILQTYKLPKALAQERQGPLRVYIDTTFERANDDFWKQNIEPALQRSRFLIVVVTPASLLARSDGQPNWVEREITFFTGLPQGKNVLVALVSGDMDGPLPGRLKELFPLIDIVDLTAFRPGPLAFLRRQRLLDRVLTLLAAVYDIPDTQMPVLRAEQERRKRQFAWRVATASVVLLLTVSGLAVVALVQRNKAQLERNIALSRQLAAQSNVIRDETPLLLELSTLLAIESMHRVPLLDNDQALRQSLSLLLKPMANVNGADNVYAVAFSKDGRYLVAGSGDGLARVVEVPSGKEVSRINTGGRVDVVAFSPDGRLVAVGADYKALVFETLSGKQISELTHGSSLETVTFSPDGRNVATASRDMTARVFEASTGNQIAQFQHGDAVWAARFSPDGRYLATASGDGSARVFEVETQKLISQLDHGASVNTVVFSPDGAAVATASDDYTARVFETSTGKELARLYHTTSVFAVAFSPDGLYLATSSQDATARIFEIKNAREVSRLVHSGVIKRIDMGLITRIMFSPDGRSVVTAGQDGTARVFDAGSGLEIGRVPHGDRVTDVALSPDGRYLATASFDHTIRLREVARYNELSRFSTPLADKLVFSPDGRYLAATNRIANSVPVFNATTGKQVLKLEYRAVGAAFSPDGTHVALAGGDKVARIFETATGTPGLELMHEGELYAVAWSPDGRVLATSSVFIENNHSFTALRLFDAQSGRQQWRLNYDGLLTGLAVSPGGHYLAGGFGASSDTRLLDTQSGKQIRLDHEGGLLAISFSRNGQFVALGSGDGVARIYEIASGRKLAELTHEDWVNDVAFSPDSRYLATASRDRTARVYEAVTGQEVSRIHQQYPILAVDFTPDGKALLTAAMGPRETDYEVTIHRDLLQPEELIGAACQRLTRNFTQKEWSYYVGGEPYRKICPGLP
ncbi:MAG TPA: TIR domain-containing protein [Candidatus Angelobacter sp.]